MSEPRFTTPLAPENFHALVNERIHDERLRRNVVRATATSLHKRADVIRDYDDWEAMRHRAHEIKREIIEHLDRYLQLFEDNATKNGMTVHYARDASEARAIIIGLCKRHDARLVVKAKSMVTEEIDLRHALEREAIETVETDLGEYIVQLANEIPSHITAPALHKSREEIGELFAEKLGIEYTPEPEKLTAIARQVLREKFLAADVGISGVNLAVADTGSLCIVENEGNVRMSISLPRVHIAVMGIEKLVPDFDALAHFLSMLARSATGQRMTSYTNLIHGPRRTNETDGPNEVHVVIVDNGRTAMLADPKLREALFCIRCGACMNVCPVYQKIGGHGYGSIYSGPIGSILTPVYQGIDRAKNLPFASSLCGACAEICPVKIDIHHALLWLRKNVVDRKSSHWIERLVVRGWMHAMKSQRMYQLSGTLLRWFAPLMRGPRESMRVPVWSKTKDFQMPPAQTFRQLWAKEQEQS